MSCQQVYVFEWTCARCGATKRVEQYDQIPKMPADWGRGEKRHAAALWFRDLCADCLPHPGPTLTL